MPKNAHPDLLVGFDTYDDAGVFRMSEDTALVQTMDFFTPIVDDPYAYGAIAAANSLSDVYAMGGRPITVMNIACFDPTMAEANVWAAIFKGMADKCQEAGAAVVGGHSVEDKQPKFGLSVTGLVNPSVMLHNAGAEPGDRIYLSKPLGTGIITTAAKFNDCPDEALSAAIETMSMLNAEASRKAVEAGSRCATDITGFGLAGHLFNIARASSVSISIDSAKLPLLPNIAELVERKNTTGGGKNNREFIGENLSFSERIPGWMEHLAVDPQTSGGLAIFATKEITGYPEIGYVSEGSPSISLS